ncbi:MAG: glycosyltransferase family 39 protein [Deltaproteobacteria bacterium]|nr:glycosyltransferase family 39 protein [Deltaproteobacteria bacterium]
MQTTLVQQGITILFLTGWCLLTMGVGRLCLSSTAIRLISRSEGLFLSAGIGLVITGYAVFLLGATGSLSAPGIGLLLISMALFAGAGWLRPLQIAPAAPSGRPIWELPALLLLAILLLASFVLTLTPEISKDALIYHLAVPKLYLLHHGFYFIPGNAFTGFPLLGEMNYLLALFLRNDILAKAMSYALLCGTLRGICLFARHVLQKQQFPTLSILIFASIPSVFAVSHTAYNDLFVTFFTLAAIYSFFRWSEDRLTAWLILCGLFSGAAAACKYTALLATPLGCLGILYLANRSGDGSRETLRRLALYVAAALIAGSPFYLKNWIVMGNPFYPFFYGIFGGKGWDPDQARLFDLLTQSLGMGRSFLDYLLLPWNLSLRAKMDVGFDGMLGPIFLLTLPFLAALRRWETPLQMLLIYALLTFFFWASSVQQMRHLIPIFPLLALIVGAILTRYRSRKNIFALLLCIVAGSLVFNGYHIARDFIKINPLPVAVGLESRDHFLSRTLPTYTMYHFVNQTLPPDARVFLIYMKNYTFLCERDCYADEMFEAHTLQKILREEASPDRVRNRLKAAGFTHLLYNEFYLLGEPSPLSAEEKQLFLAFQNSHLVNIRQQGYYRLYRLI